MRQLPLVVILVMASGALGFGLGLRVRASPEPTVGRVVTPFDARPLAITTASGSHYLGQLHDGAHDVDKLWTMFVGDSAPDRLPVECRDVCRVHTSRAAYVEAMGAIALPAVAARWERIRTAPVGSFRHVFMMHYPRPDLPGRCVTVQATFSTVRDPAFHASRPGDRRGLLFHVRKTYRLDGGRPRLIEAGVEAHDCRPGRTNYPGGYRYREILGDAAADPNGTSHFLDLGDGPRAGYAWTEQGSCAYKDGKPRTPLTEAEIRALLEFVARA